MGRSSSRFIYSIPSILIMETPTTLKRIPVREHLDYWGYNYLKWRMLDYGRRYLFKDNTVPLNCPYLWGTSLEDLVEDVFYKVLSGQRNWEKSNVPGFLEFLINCLHSEIDNYRKKESRIYINEGMKSHFLYWKNNQDKFLYNAF